MLLRWGHAFVPLDRCNIIEDADIVTDAEGRVQLQRRLFGRLRQTHVIAALVQLIIACGLSGVGAVIEKTVFLRLGAPELFGSFFRHGSLTKLLL